DPSTSLAYRRDYLWLDENSDLREKLLTTRYFINAQPIKLNQKVSKKLKAQVEAVAKANVNEILKLSADVRDSTNKEVDSVAVRAYFSRFVDQTLDLGGNYVSVVFQNDYINRASRIIGKLKASDSLINNDEFCENLMNYTTNAKVALNS